MERILSTTFGKHSNFWSGNRLIITNSTDTAMDLYKVPDCQNVDGVHCYYDVMRITLGRFRMQNNW